MYGFWLNRMRWLFEVEVFSSPNRPTVHTLMPCWATDCSWPVTLKVTVWLLHGEWAPFGHCGESMSWKACGWRFHVVLPSMPPVHFSQTGCVALQSKAAA